MSNEGQIFLPLYIILPFTCGNTNISPKAKCRNMKHYSLKLGEKATICWGMMFINTIIKNISAISWRSD